jgi:hypothetical protein
MGTASGHQSDRPSKDFHPEMAVILYGSDQPVKQLQVSNRLERETYYRAYIGGNRATVVNLLFIGKSQLTCPQSRLMFLYMGPHHATQFHFQDNMILYSRRNSGCLAKDPEGYLEVQMNTDTVTQQNCLQGLSANRLGEFKVATMLVEMQNKNTLFCSIAANRLAIEQAITQTKIDKISFGYYVKVVDNPRGDKSCRDTGFNRFSLLLRNVPGKLSGEGKTKSAVTKKSQRDNSIATGAKMSQITVGKGQSNLVVEPTSGARYSHRTTVQRSPKLHLQGSQVDLNRIGES